MNPHRLARRLRGGKQRPIRELAELAATLFTTTDGTEQ